MLNYLDDFPIDSALIPERLRLLLQPVGKNPGLRVDVTTRFKNDPYGPASEYLHMIMVLAPNASPGMVGQFREVSDGVVYSPEPDVMARGGLRDFDISVSGVDYIVMSRGGGSYFGYQLAEKVMVALGLTPRVLGGENQKLIYDDLSLPEFGVADGEVALALGARVLRRVAANSANWSPVIFDLARVFGLLVMYANLSNNG